jgi:hypothetical protein
MSAPLREWSAAVSSVAGSWGVLTGFLHDAGKAAPARCAGRVR